MTRIIPFLICSLVIVVSLNTIETLWFNKHVFAQGLQHHSVSTEEDSSVDTDKANNQEVPSEDDEAARIAEIKQQSTINGQDDLRALKHMKTVTISKAIDSQRLITTDGEIIYLEGLYIPEDNDNDINTKLFIEEHFLNKEVELYSCKKTKCKTKDRYGHTRAHVVTQKDKIWLQAALIISGHAQIRTRNDWPILIEEMLRLELQARSNKDGLWNDTVFIPKDAQTVPDTLRGFHLVEGIVQSVAMHKNVVYLNFGANWRKDFTVVVPSGVRRKFLKSNIDIMSKGGSPLRVRGWIDSYNGPFIEIDHIEQIEWLKTDN